MSTRIHGKDVAFAMKVGSDYYPFFCGKNGSFQLDQDEIEVTNVNSGPNRDFVPGMSAATFTVDGVNLVNNSSSRVSVLYLMQQAIRRVIQDCRVRLTDEDGNSETLTFQAFLTSTSFSRDIPSFSQSSATWRITGPITFSSVIPDPVAPICEVQDALYITGTLGGTQVHHSSLDPEVGYTKTVLQVHREGVGFTETSGTPSGRQFKFTRAAGTIDFDTSLPFLGFEVVYVLYKKTTT